MNSECEVYFLMPPIICLSSNWNYIMPMVNIESHKKEKHQPKIMVRTEQLKRPLEQIEKETIVILKCKKVG